MPMAGVLALIKPCKKRISPFRDRPEIASNDALIVLQSSQ